MRRHPVKENNVGSVVSEILSYMYTHRQSETLTDKQTFCYILQELAAMHIEASRVQGGSQLPILLLNEKIIQNLFWGEVIFLGPIYRGRVNAIL